MAQDPTAETKTNDNQGNANTNNRGNIESTEQTDTTSSTSTVSTLHRAVVAGATGAIGRHCVYLLARDPRVESVTALTRSGPKNADFYGFDEKIDSDAINKLSHLIINYNGTVDDISQELKTYIDDEKEGKEFTIGMSGIGVYGPNTKNEADFMAREYEPNIKIATAAARNGAKKWSYLRYVPIA